MSAEQAPWRRQSSQLSGGGSTPSPGPPSAGDGVTDSSNTAPSFPVPAPPPPPPPAPAPGLLPTVRLSTEIPDTRLKEPPAAIQNAMMTKDKKPFTYTPGGLDLSQIRSPRMQRRITRNANAEGVSGDHPQVAPGPKTSPLAQQPGPLPPSALAAMQPQMAVPVFPTGGGGVQLHHVNAPPGSHAPPPPPPPPAPAPVEPPPAVHRAPPPPAPPAPVVQIIPKAPPAPPTPVVQVVPKVAPAPVAQPVQNEPGSIYVPPVTSRAQVGSLYIPPINNNNNGQPPQQQTPMSPIATTLNKAPTPWMNQHQRQQQAQSVPSWVVNREEAQPPTQQQQQSAGVTRIIPIQVEGRSEPVQPPQPPQSQQHSGSTRIIPIQMEGSNSTTSNQQRWPVYVHNKFNPQSPQSPPTPTSPPVSYNHSDSQSDQNARQYQQQQSWGPPGGNGAPTQSRSFRVLQKITDTDNSEGEADLPVQEYGPPTSGGGQWTQGVPVQQLRKLQLNDDDRALMNKFRAQVDEDSFLHTESDPRYRGPAIPSRAFRMLQNMTDGMADYGEQVPRGPAMSSGPQTRQVPVQQASSGDGMPQAYVPPSEQQVQEPRKYTGGAIPSRSFRMLQAMTAPENCATGDDNSMGQWAQYDPGYWGPEAWWGCYPSQTPDMSEGWDPYSAMYAYMAEVNAAYGFPPIPYPPMYSPHHFAPPRSARYPHGGSSDSEDCSGYSSTDEMAYYGANFARGMMPPCTPRVPMYGMPPPPPPSIVVTKTPPVNKVPEQKKAPKQQDVQADANVPRPPSSVDLDAYETAESDKGSDDEEASDSDTEVEDDKDEKNKEDQRLGSGGQLQAVRSVSDINVYKSNEEDEEETDDDEEEEGEEEEEEEEEEKAHSDECIPHQLSVIYEESEQSDAESMRHTSRASKHTSRTTSSSLTTSEDGDSSTTLDNGDDESDGDYDAMDTESSTVTVRLPLKLKFSRSENDEEVTTVIVGDEQVKRQEVVSEPEPEKEEIPKAKEETPDVSVTICFSAKPNSSKKVEQWQRDTSQFNSEDVTPPNKASSKTRATKPSEEVDAYETAESDSDVSVCLSLPLRKRQQRGSGFESINNISEEEEDEEDGKASSHCEDDSSSTTSIQTVRMTSGSRGRSSGSEIEEVLCNKSDSSIRTEVNKLEAEDKHETDSEEEESSESGKTSTSSKSCVSNKETAAVATKNVPVNVEDDDDDDDDGDDDSSEDSDESQDEKEQDIIQKIYNLCTDPEKAVQKPKNTGDAKNKDLECNGDANADPSKANEGTRKRLNSKSQEESEEDDSGVTSDMSRPISDADTESEAGRCEQHRLMQCQRASTHSRLFKLLQDECGKSDDEDDEDIPSRNKDMKSRREHLTLPLRNTNGSDPDSLSSSSGVTSPASPTVTDRLVKELVQSLLQRKKGRRLKKLPLAKLHAAALRILQEDMDPYDTGSSEDSTGNMNNNNNNNNNQQIYLPPASHHSNNTANPGMYGANYYDYCDYYDSWAYYGAEGPEYDIMPSRAFKLLSEHAQPGGFSSGVINGLWAKCPRLPNSSRDLSGDTDKTEPSSSSLSCPPQSAPASARAT